MSKPSIRTGSSSMPSASASSESASTRSPAAALAAQLVLGERELGVALGELAQPALVAALGDPHLDRAAAALAERLGEQPGALARASGPTTTSRGTAGDGRVVLGDELLGHLVARRSPSVVEVEALALGEHPVADLEDLGVGLRRPRPRPPIRSARPDRLAGDAAGAPSASGPPSSRSR